VPEVVRLGLPGGPGGLLGTVEGIGLVGREIVVLFQLLEDPVDAAVDALLVLDVDVEGGVKFAERPQVVIQRIGVTPREGLLVGGEERKAAGCPSSPM